MARPVHENAQRRVLLTGVAGFVGSHLADRLIEEDWEVIGVDNLLTGRRKNLAHLTHEPRFHFIEAPVEHLPDIEAPVDWVMHFASPASPPKYQAAPVACMRCNSEGTLALLELARANAASFLLASTSEIYGDPQIHPQVESYPGYVNPTGPRSMYDEAKRYAEALAATYRREYDVDTRIIRIFNTYGPRMAPDDGRVISNFVCQALEKRPLTIYGDGTQTRSFQYIDDLVDGIVSLMRTDYREPVNLGNPDEHTILDLAQMVRELLGGSAELTFCPLPKDDPTRRRPDIERARGELGWEPAITLREGLAHTIAYFRDELELPRPLPSTVEQLAARTSGRQRPSLSGG